MKKHPQRTAILLTSLCILTKAQALVNFEIQGPLLDDAAIPLDYDFTEGDVTFRFGVDRNGYVGGIVREAGVYLEATGSSTGEAQSSFLYNQGNKYDTESPLASTVSPFGLGNFFLRTDPVGTGSTNSLQNDGLFVIEYTSGSPTQASGQIWDIDGDAGFTEQFRIKAWAADGVTELASVVSPVGTLHGITSLDGMPWEFSIASPGDLVAIRFITINFIGTKTTGIGLAFDNFNAVGSVIPEPSTYALLFGLTAITAAHSRRRRK